MDRKTFNDAMSQYVSFRPFHPFTVALANGDRLEIDHPDAIAFRNGTALFAGPSGTPHIFDYQGVTQIIGDLAGNNTDLN